MTVTMRTSWNLIVMAEHKGRKPETSSAVEAARYPVISAGRPLCSHTPRHTLITALHAQLERQTQGRSEEACDYLYNSLLHLKKEKNIVVNNAKKTATHLSFLFFFLNTVV